MMINLLSTVFTSSETLIIVIISVVGVLLIALNVALAYIFHKRGERKLCDMMLQQQREMLMQQLDRMRSGEIKIENTDEQGTQPFFASETISVPEEKPAENEETEPEEPVIVEETEEPEEPYYDDEIEELEGFVETTEDISEDATEDEAEEDEIEEAEEIEDADFSEDENVEVVEEVVINGKVIRYNRSFTARLTQSSDEVKNRYSQLKNYMLSHKGVKNRVSWKKETFRFGRNTLAMFVVRGKTLCLCLALNPSRFADSKYKVIDLSVRSSKTKMPCMYRISSTRRVKYAKELIDLLFAEYGLMATPGYVCEDYKPSYQTTETLIDLGLIKVTGEIPAELADKIKAPLPQIPVQPVAAEQALTAEPVEEVITEEPVEEILTSEPVEEVITEEPVEEIITEEPVEEVLPVEELPEEELREEEVITELPKEEEDENAISAEDVSDKMTDDEAKSQIEVDVVKPPMYFKGRKSTIINIGSLSRNFEAGDTVNIEILRERGLIVKDAAYVKVLAKGSLNKPLIVEADDFSLEAVKMIILTGGRAIRRKISE